MFALQSSIVWKLIKTQQKRSKITVWTFSIQLKGVKKVFLPPHRRVIIPETYFVAFVPLQLAPRGIFWGGPREERQTEEGGEDKARFPKYVNNQHFTCHYHDAASSDKRQTVNDADVAATTFGAFYLFVEVGSSSVMMREGFRFHNGQKSHEVFIKTCGWHLHGKLQNRHWISFFFKLKLLSSLCDDAQLLEWPKCLFLKHTVIWSDILAIPKYVKRLNGRNVFA